MRYKQKRPVTRPGAGYSQALDELYGNNECNYPPPRSNCNGPLPIGHFLAIALARIEAQAVKRTPQRRAA